MRRTIFCFALLGTSWIGTPAHGELFLLKTGGQVEGEFLNPSRAREDAYRVRTTPGLVLALAPEQVSRVVIVTEIQQQYQKLLPTVPNTTAGHLDMARWCLESGLISQRNFHLEQVLKLDADHEQARLALGYSRHGSVWLKPDEFMQKQGYVRYKGSWRMKQDVEIEAGANDREVAEKEWRQKLKMWRGWLGKKRDAEARTQISGIRDPAAVTALVEVVVDTAEPRDLRQECLDVLGRIPGGAPTGMLIKLGMNDPDQGLRDRALDELRKRRSPEALAEFIKQLKNKDNRIVNRAATCLERLDNKDATVPLIDALVTEHKYAVSTSSSPGGIGASFDGSGGSGGGAGPGGGLNMGGKPQIVKQKHNNEKVLSALTRLTGANHGYSVDAWKRWYTETQTSTIIDLRRNE